MNRDELPGSTGVNIAFGLLDEVERLRAVNADLRMIVDGLENAAHEERAAVVAWLRKHWFEVLEQTPQQTAKLIERGEHRREEKR